MVLFFEYKAQQPRDSEPCCYAWCKTDTILAIGNRANEVNMFLGEGNLMEKGTITGKCNPSALEWHPRARVLCSGWTNGKVVFFDARDCVPKQPSKQPHHTRIMFVKWNGTGNRLVTGDTGGVLAVWGAQGITRSMNVMTQYRKNGSLDHCVWCNENLNASSSVRGNRGGADHAPFFFGGEQGVIYYGDDMGNSMMVQSLNSPIDALMFYAGKSRLVAVTRSLMLVQMQVSANGKVSPLMKVKLSMAAENGISGAVWAGDGLLATCAREGFVRFWDLAHNENYHLSIMSASEIDGGRKLSREDRISRLDYNPNNQTIAAGSQDGNIVMWRNLNAGFAKGVSRVVASSADDWRPLPVHLMNGSIKGLIWGPGDHQLAASTTTGTSILNQSVLHRKLSSKYSVIQVNERDLAIHTVGDPDDRYKKSIEAGINILGLDVYGEYVAVWNDRKIEVYDLGGSDKVNRIGAFPSKSSSCALQDQSIFTAVRDGVEKRNMSGGSIITKLSFTEAEGVPTHMDANGKYLAVVTDKGVIKMFDVSRREPKQLFSNGKFCESDSPQELVGIVKSVKCNADGTCVSIISERMRGKYLRAPDSRLHVYHCEMQSVLHYDFAEKGRYPIAHFWDSDEPRLLACETHKLAGGSNKASKKKSKAESKSSDERKSSKESDEADPLTHISESVVTTLFATSEHGLLKQDENTLSSEMGALLGLSVPNLYFVGATHSRRVSASRLMSRALRDFTGLTSVNEEVKKALLDFSFFLTIGDMDKAYSAVRLINEPQVWENMALMCVKTKRLDVAEVCLGNMGHARGARAVRLAKNEPQVEAQIAMVAVQVGLLEDAEKCYIDCGRWDLLNKLYQSSGQWEKSLQVAKTHDRIHLRNTHYKYAKHLEAMGDLPQAVMHYELSGTFAKEIPRMLFDQGKVDRLRKYVHKKDDPKLYKWWGQYCESNQEYEAALQYYSRANEPLCLARVHCLAKDFDSAVEVVQSTGDKAAAYFVARQFELTGDMKSAIQFFSKSGRYNHAVRLAQEAGFDSDLMSLSLMSNPKVMISSAKYFESKGSVQQAVQLYQHAGRLSKALDLCFRARLFDELRNIADDLAAQSGKEGGAKVAPETLTKCASFLMEHGQYDKAVHLFIIGGKVEESIEMCAQHKVKITEDMADKMTPEKGDPRYPNSARKEILLKLASVCKKQNSYHLATKKYTQAGDKLKAMKCLLKSGDTEKITFFANVSRNRDIYILAANYLQNLDWHNTPETMKAIILFYTKAKAYEQLSSFYDACAQVEIDEYREYDRAIAALKESERFLQKAKNTPAATKAEKIAVLQQRIVHIEQFANAKRNIKSDPDESVRVCNMLLQERDIERAIRVGDIFALLVEFYYGNNSFSQAHEMIERMRDRNIVLNPYLDQEMVNKIYKEMGVSDAPQKQGNYGNGRNDDSDEMEEELNFGSDSEGEADLMSLHK